ncbi:MAG: hypothetical protein LBG60_09865 [Bifidobacteriaceae bacterium]|jgi:hypothetical protein|nr:hypothetical protein [Bifidobacteriaceae bacterium]
MSDNQDQTYIDPMLDGWISQWGSAAKRSCAALARLSQPSGETGIRLARRRASLGASKRGAESGAEHHGAAMKKACLNNVPRASATTDADKGQ